MKLNLKFYNLLILAGAMLVGCSQGSKKGKTAAPDSADKKEIVRVLELQPQIVARSVEYPATLLPYEEVHLAPASPGRIEAIYADVGDRIAAGTTLVQMDRTQLHQAEVQLKNLETDFYRLDTLSKYGSIAEQQFDQLKAQYDIAKSNVEFLQKNIRLLAPFNGVISGRYFEPGEMFTGSPNTQAGKAAVLSIVRIDNLKVETSLSEKYFPLVKKGMETDIKVDVYPNQVFVGKINRIHPTISPLDRTFKVEIVVSNREGILRPGMFARVNFDLDEEEAILLPGMAVLKMQGSNDRYLFVEKNGVAHRVAFTIGIRYDDNIEVFSNELHPGDKVIVQGQARLVDGVQVEVRK